MENEAAARLDDNSWLPNCWRKKAGERVPSETLRPERRPEYCSLPYRWKMTRGILCPHSHSPELYPIAHAMCRTRCILAGVGPLGQPLFQPDQKTHSTSLFLFDTESMVLETPNSKSPPSRNPPAGDADPFPGLSAFRHRRAEGPGPLKSRTTRRNLGPVGGLVWEGWVGGVGLGGLGGL